MSISIRADPLELELRVKRQFSHSFSHSLSHTGAFCSIQPVLCAFSLLSVVARQPLLCSIAVFLSGLFSGGSLPLSLSLSPFNCSNFLFYNINVYLNQSNLLQSQSVV